MPAKVRRFGESDAEAAVDLLRHFQTSGGLDIHGMEQFLSNPGTVLIGATVDGTAAGFAIAYSLPRLDGEPDMLFLYEIEVLEEHRRKGLARAMIEELKDRAEGKFFILTQRSNQPATSLYEATGARPVEPDDVLYAFGDRLKDSNRG